MRGTVEEVLCGEHGGEHGVVLIVILVKAIAAEYVEIVELAKILMDDVKVIMEICIVHGICLLYTQDKTFIDF